MSFVTRAWRSDHPAKKGWLAFLVLLVLLAGCTPVSSSAPAATPTGPLLTQDQAIQTGLGICNSGRITSSVKPKLDSVELTTNQAIAARLGRPSWADLPPDSPVWLVKYTGAFTLAVPPAQGATPQKSATAAPALGPFPACWAIIEARTGARGTVYIPDK